jgi:hypothetical protein
MKCEKRGYFTDCNGKKSWGRILSFWIILLGSVVILCSLIGYFIEKEGWQEILFSGFGLVGLSAGGKGLQTAFEKFGTVKEPGPQPEPGPVSTPQQPEPGPVPGPKLGVGK